MNAYFVLISVSVIKPLHLRCAHADRKREGQRSGVVTHGVVLMLSSYIEVTFADHVS